MTHETRSEIAYRTHFQVFHHSSLRSHLDRGGLVLDLLQFLLYLQCQDAICSMSTISFLPYLSSQVSITYNTSGFIP